MVKPRTCYHLSIFSIFTVNNKMEIVNTCVSSSKNFYNNFNFLCQFTLSNNSTPMLHLIVCQSKGPTIRR